MAIYIHSGMTGAPSMSTSGEAGRVNSVLSACLVDGFNVKAVSSASAAAGVLTLNFASDPGFEALATLAISGSSVAAANGKFKVLSVGSNQVLLSAPLVPDGAVGGSISAKFAPLGWTRPFATAANVSVFRQPGAQQRYLRVAHPASDAAYFRGYRTMTALSTGTEPFPTTAQQANPGFGTYNSTAAAPSWWLSGDELGFYFSAAQDAISPMFGLFFGDLVEGAKPGDQYLTTLVLTGYGYMVRGHAGASGSVYVAPSPSFAEATAYPGTISNGLMALPYAPIIESSVWRGILPNSYLASCPGGFDHTLSGVTGLSGRARFFCGDGAPGSRLIAVDGDTP